MSGSNRLNHSHGACARVFRMLTVQAPSCAGDGAGLLGRGVPGGRPEGGGDPGALVGGGGGGAVGGMLHHGEELLALRHGGKEQEGHHHPLHAAEEQEGHHLLVSEYQSQDLKDF